MVEVVLPNDANPLGFILGGSVMHLIDIAGAITAFRHARALMVTAAVDSLEFLNPIKVGDFIVLKGRVTATFRTSLEVEVLELPRIPPTTSLLATYEVALDAQGELIGYRRIRRYERGRADPR